MTIELSPEPTTKRFSHCVAVQSGLSWSISCAKGRRETNQDAWGEISGSRFVVADGVGGSSGGALASRAAVAEFLSIDPATGWSAGLAALNEHVRRVCAQAGFEDAGSTLVGCDLDLEFDSVDVVNVGDSRVYLRSDSRVSCLTSDQTVGNFRIAQGRSFRDDSDGLGKAQWLMSFIGIEAAHLTIDTSTHRFGRGDRLLLCSDGVHSQLSDELVEQIFAHAPIENVAALLTSAAEEAGARDNATAIAIERL